MSDIDHVLYGHNPLERVVAVEPDGDSMTAILFQRTSTGGAEEHVVPFIPWLLTTEDRSFPGSEILMLAGDGFNRKVKFRKSGWRGFLDARRQLRENNEQIMTYGSQSRQFLTETGITLFKGMNEPGFLRVQMKPHWTKPVFYDRAAFLQNLAVLVKDDKIVRIHNHFWCSAFRPRTLDCFDHAG